MSDETIHQTNSDNAVYQKLDSSGKQRYILELSNKFRELKERYYREKTGS